MNTAEIDALRSENARLRRDSQQLAKELNDKDVVSMPFATVVGALVSKYWPSY